MDELSDPVVIGVVVAPHGVRGSLRVRALGPGRHLRKGTEPVVAGMRRRISTARQTSKGFLLDRKELDVPEEGEYYVTDLVGLTAVDDAGEVVGKVMDTFETAAHEVLVVCEDDRQDLYLPFTLEHVPEVDLRAGQVLIRPPEG